MTNYSQTIARNPDYADAYYNNRGYAYWEKGERDLATADFNQAAALNPDYVDPYY